MKNGEGVIFHQHTNDYKRHSLLWFIMMVVITFFYVYQFDLSFLGLGPQIHSVRVASVVIVFIAFIRVVSSGIQKMPPPAVNRFRRYVRVQLLLFLYMVILALSFGKWDGTHMMIVLINVFLFSFIPIVAYYQVVDSLDDFMIIIFGVTFVQSLIIWLCALNPQLSTIIDVVFNRDAFGDYDMARMRTSYAGGIGCITSSGVVRFSVGLVACTYLYYTKRKLIFLILLLYFGLTCSMLARTGIIVSIFSLLFVAVFILNKISINSFIILLFPIIVSLLFMLIISDSDSVSSFFEDHFSRASQLAEERSSASSIKDISFFQEYFSGASTRVPPLSLKTFFYGTGVVSGKAGNGSVINVDGGFFRLYGAYGFIVAFFFYCYFFGEFFRMAKSYQSRAVRFSLLLMLLFILIGEFKEFNIYTSCQVPFFFLIALLASKEYLLNKTTSLSL